MRPTWVYKKQNAAITKIQTVKDGVNKIVCDRRAASARDVATTTIVPTKANGLLEPLQRV